MTPPSPLHRPDLDRAALGLHATRCRAAHGHLFRVGCLAESAHAFLAPRFVTTLVVATVALWTLSALA